MPISKRFLRVYRVARWPLAFFSSWLGFFSFWGAVAAVYAVGTEATNQITHGILYFIGSFWSVVLTDEGGLYGGGLLIVLACFAATPCLPGWLMKWIERRVGIAHHFEPTVMVDRKTGALMFKSVEPEV